MGHYTGGERRSAVVRQLHDTHPEVAEQLERCELTAEHLGALEGENDSELALALGPRHVGGVSHRSEVVPVQLDQLLHLRDRADSVCKVVVDSAEGQLDHVDAAAAYQVEIGLRHRQPIRQRRG